MASLWQGWTFPEANEGFKCLVWKCFEMEDEIISEAEISTESVAITHLAVAD